MKLAILVCGLCGLASAFLGDPSVWHAREAMGASVAAYVLGFGVAAVVGGWRLARPPMKAHHAITALAGTLCALVFYRGAFGELLRLAPLRDHTAASLLFAVGFYGGIASAIAAIVSPPTS